MDESHFRSLLANFPSVRVLAVGDIYLDENVFGVVTGVSLEAPIPVFEVRERRHNPGAAGNAACNAAALGARVTVAGVVGDDANAGIVREEFEKRGVEPAGLIADPGRPTNTYGKLKASGHNTPRQEVLRTDTPAPTPIEGEVEARLIEFIRERAADTDVILIGDQVSSTINANVLAAIMDVARDRGILTVADSRDRAGMFHGVDAVVPNDAEAGLAAGIDVLDEESLHAAGRYLLQSAKNALVTRGPKGITIFSADGAIEHVPLAAPVPVIDVTGAGDTVAAAVALTLASGGSLRDAAVLGNTAAGIAVGQPDVVTVALAEVEQALFGQSGPAKLKRLDDLQRIARQLNTDGKRIVWTNGCFDILHAGHITYLVRARQEGDVLILGLNTDASVQENKGPDRPVIDERDRATVLSALDCVDYLLLFDDKSPIRLIEALQPHVYAKGGDYTLDSIDQDERRAVEAYGGTIALIPGIEGHSTTSIIDRVTGG